MKNSKIIAIVQARLGSTRLPGKTLMTVGDDTLLGYELRRIRRAKKIDHLVVATTTNSEDDALEKFCQESKVDCFRGSIEDVLDRYYQCSLKYSEYDVVVRLTGDCPFADPAVIDQVVEFFLAGNYDYASNVLVETFPDGLDVEVFSREALAEAAAQAKLLSEREHVTLYLRNQAKFKKGNVAAKVNLARIRLTVDESADLEVARFLAKNLPPDASYEEIVACLEANPDVLEKNSNIIRNAGLAKSLRQDKTVS
ncbi:MAG: glycosyltransferase family protein [Patescibacteria group bacterium]